MQPSIKALPLSTNKPAVLAQIRAAKSAHMRWRAYAQAIVSGVEIDDSKLPIKHTDCSFGKWYYGKGQVLLGHLDAYEGIATPHEMLHAIYERIYRILQGAEDQQGIAKLWTSKDAQARKRSAQAREHMDELIGVSDTLLKALEMLEQEVRESE